MLVLEQDVESEATRLRFWGKVQIVDGCWEWQAHRSTKGYGRFWLTQKRYEQAHRFAWILEHGQIPDGLHVLHRCDNPPCCNPAHLFLGTNRDNNDDKMAKGRLRRGSQVGELHSQHKFTEEQVLEMRTLWASGEWTQAALAERFGVYSGTVCKVVNRQRWSHLP